MTTRETHAAMRDAMERLGPWFHNVHLPQGLQTAPDHWLGDFPTNKWETIWPFIPQDLTGCSVLDIVAQPGHEIIIAQPRDGARRPRITSSITSSARFV